MADHLLGAEYDAILMDVMMPGKDGFTLVSELRAKGVDTPILFLTARDSVADRVAGWTWEQMIIWLNPLTLTSCWPAFGP